MKSTKSDTMEKVNIAFAKRIKFLRASKGKDYSQTDFMNDFNEWAINNKLDYRLTINTIKNYEGKKSMPRIDMLCAIADFWDKSVDYMLGRTEYTCVSNELVSKEYELTESALNGIKRINTLASEQLERYAEGYSKGIVLAQQDTQKHLLNYLLSSDTFHAFLFFYLDYIYTSFTVPVYYDEDKGQMVVSQNPYSYRNGKWVLNVASSFEHPGDCRPIIVDKSFFEQVAKGRMDMCIDELKCKYIEIQKAYCDILSKEYNKRGE